MNRARRIPQTGQPFFTNVLDGPWNASRNIGGITERNPDTLQTNIRLRKDVDLKRKQQAVRVADGLSSLGSEVGGWRWVYEVGFQSPHAGHGQPSK